MSYHGPEIEQLDLAEDIERLSEIGDLIRAGHASIADFDLKKFERAFVDGYVSNGVTS